MAKIHGPRFFWHPYSDWRVGRRGRLDGRGKIPAWKSDKQPPYIMEMKQAGDSDVRWLARAWADADRRLKAAWLDARRVLVQAERRIKDARIADADAVDHCSELLACLLRCVRRRPHQGALCRHPDELRSADGPVGWSTPEAGNREE